MELRSQAIEGELLAPDSGFASARTRLEQRWDPLTGHSSRLVSSPDALFPPERFEDYLATERRLGRRHLGGTGTVEWLASFAPLGPAELRAFLPGVASPAELSGDRVAELAHGVAIALGLYVELGFQSFNLALYGAPAGTAGYPLNLRMLARSNLDTPYRSDATFMERLHWEAALDLTITPEAVADRAGDRFRR
ncbi:MAG TPA: hypothetical protein VE776_02625 [Actinomycetota bacterium]|nr:hypothetical protein [Actinomycetota bacterium]